MGASEDKLEGIVSRETISSYISLLEKWNKSINLVSKSSLDEALSRHVYDCMGALEFIEKDEIVVDLGSGAGLPGMILSYAGVNTVHLVESDKKKTAFLQEAKKLSQNNVYIHQKRIEHLDEIVCNVITSRALASLPMLFEYAMHICKDAKLVLFKGKTYKNEIEEAKLKFDFEFRVVKSRICDESVILLIDKYRKNEKL